MVASLLALILAGCIVPSEDGASESDAPAGGTGQATVAQTTTAPAGAAFKLAPTHFYRGSVAFSHQGGPCLDARSDVNRFFVLDSHGSSTRVDGLHPAWEATDIDESKTVDKVCIGDKVGIVEDEDVVQWKGALEIYGTSNGTKWATIPWEFPEYKPKPGTVTVRSPSAGILEVTLVSAPDGPFDMSQTTQNFIRVDGNQCTSYNTSPWKAGGVQRFSGSSPGCGAAIQPGASDVAVQVTLEGVLVNSSAVDIQD